MTDIAKMLIEDVIEARVVPEKIRSAAIGGAYDSLIDNEWVFRFELENDAVEFMNTVNAMKGHETEDDTSMDVEADGYYVYVPIVVYDEEPKGGWNDDDSKSAEPADNYYDRPEVSVPPAETDPDPVSMISPDTGSKDIWKPGF